MAKVPKKHTTVINERVNPSLSSTPKGGTFVRWQIKKWLYSKSKSSNEEQQRNKNMDTGNDFDISVMVKQEGTKYKSLFRALSKNVINLNQGYRCLEQFHKAEKVAISKKEKSVAKGYSIGWVKFVMRNQFYGFKQIKNDVITPSRFASIVTLAADVLFRRKLIHDSAAMVFGYRLIKNTFADKHGFSVNKVPETLEEMKLFYYYLTTTEGVHGLMNTRPDICMAIAKWRIHGKHPERLHLHKNVLVIDEVYASCLRLLWTSSYETQMNVSSQSYNPIDFIKNKSLLRKILNEFDFLEKYASSPQ